MESTAYMEETKWVVEINKELKSNGSSSVTEKEQWKRHSIYKVPSRVTELNKKVYQPQAVSFGPYHYGEEHLKGMEEHKHRALIHFLKRCKKPIELVFQRMDEVVQELRDSYNPLDQIWKQDTSKFLQMMILDGCFMLEILGANESVPDDYADNDPIFGEHGKLYVMPYIKRDMLVLENQLPMKILHILIEIETNTTQEDEWLNKQILNFFTPGSFQIGRSIGKCIHILDVFRKSLIQQGPTHPTPIPKATNSLANVYKWFREERGDDIMRSATELHDAGIRFKKSKTNSLGDVSFDQGLLRLPTMVVDDTTQCMFLNLIAFERLHVGAGNEITSYIFFIDTIIDDEMDVALLHRRGILINALGNDKDVAKLFNSLSKDISVDLHPVFDMVQMSMNNYCKKPWNKWRANLIHTYFRNPWAIVSLIAAILLFTLTIIQTLYTIKQSYQSPSPTAAPSMIPPRIWHRP
ncbi:hypothetical protein VNO77_30070 [Canavalia gladiata]|uniref:Uncharacterized protein n=1 Tax=Canavalia gladiata TaxID=3824 RepID=A0AAN9KP39_CANGL